jgi:hypothetical protein
MAVVLERLPAVLDVAALPPDTAIVVVRQNRLDAVFPYVPLADLQCDPDWQDTRSRRAGEPANRPYAWLLSHDYPDASLLMDDAIFTGVRVVLPAGVTPTEARLDSVLGRAGVLVRRFRCPALTTCSGSAYFSEPDRRAIYFDHGRLHFVMQGDSAVGDFAGAGTNRIRLGWCARPRARSEITVPLLRR